MTAPTEAEIRRIVEGGAHVWDQLSDAFGALGGTLDRLYDSEELRKSELADLDTVTADALDAIRERAKADAIEAWSAERWRSRLAIPTHHASRS
jgi:hypothetical protein